MSRWGGPRGPPEELAYGEYIPQRWDRNRFERFARAPAPPRLTEEDYRLVEQDRPGRRDVMVAERTETRSPYGRLEERDRFFEEEKVLPRRPRRRTDKELFGDVDPRELAEMALTPYRGKGRELDIDQRSIETRPRVMRRQSSLDTFDRRPVPRFEREDYHSPPYEPIPVPVPVPIRRAGRWRDGDYEDVRWRDYPPGAFPDADYREVEIRRERSFHRHGDRLPSPPSEKIEEEEIEEDVKSVRTEKTAKTAKSGKSAKTTKTSKTKSVTLAPSSTTSSSSSSETAEPIREKEVSIHETIRERAPSTRAPSIREKSVHESFHETMREPSVHESFHETIREPSVREKSVHESFHEAIREPSVREPSMVKSVHESFHETVRPESFHESIHESIHENIEETARRLKKGRTRMPKRLVRREAIMDLGYPFDEEEDFFVLRVALEKEQIDEVMRVSELYKSEKVEKRTTYRVDETVNEVVAPPAEPKTEHEEIWRREWITPVSVKPHRSSRSQSIREISPGSQSITTRRTSPARTEKTARTARSRRRSSPGTVMYEERKSRVVEEERFVEPPIEPTPPAEIVEERRIVEERAPSHAGTLVVKEKSYREDRDIQAEIRALEAERRALRLEREADEKRDLALRVREHPEDEYDLVEYREARPIGEVEFVDRKRSRSRNVVRVEKDRKERRTRAKIAAAAIATLT